MQILVTGTLKCIHFQNLFRNYLECFMFGLLKILLCSIWFEMEIYKISRLPFVSNLTSHLHFPIATESLCNVTLLSVYVI